MDSTTYKVLKDFDTHKAGDMLTDADFSGAEAVAASLESGFIEKTDAGKSADQTAPAKPQAVLDYEDRVAEVRASMLGIEEAVLALNKLPDELVAIEPHSTEILANVMLAYRHAEDVRMRLGKVFQAIDGGASAYKR